MGIEGLGNTGPLVYRGASLETSTQNTKVEDSQRLTGTVDANQTRGGLNKLQEAAGITDGVTVHQSVDLYFQDRTPTNQGSTVQPGPMEVYQAGADLTKSLEVTKDSDSLLKPIENFVSNVVRGLLGKDASFGSWGDPHEISGDGLKFDNQLTGRFVAFKSDEGDLELQKDQGPDQSGRWPGATLNHAVALKVAGDLVAYDVLKNSLTINGAEVPFKDGKLTLRGGATVDIKGSTLSVTSPRGDQIDIVKKDAYIDLSGKISGSRPKGSVSGSLGSFDADGQQDNDLVGRDGKTVAVTVNPNAGWNQVVQDAAFKAFLDGWKVRTSESLF